MNFRISGSNTGNRLWNFTLVLNMLNANWYSKRKVGNFSASVFRFLFFRLTQQRRQHSSFLHSSTLILRYGCYVTNGQEVPRFHHHTAKANKAFVLPHFQYCSVVWHFCSSRPNSEKLESLNKRAMRVVFNDRESTYSRLLDGAAATSLYSLRVQNMFSTIHKCMHINF